MTEQEEKRLKELTASMDRMTCPLCEKEFALSRVAKFTPQSEVTMTLESANGQFLSLETIGKTMTHTSELFKALADAMDFDAEVLCSDMKVEAGKVSFSFSILRTERGKLTHPKDEA